MTDFERNVIRVNDLRTGRVIPPWRFWLLYALTVVAIIVARAIPEGGWATAIIVFVWALAYFFLMDRFKQRSIS